METNSMPGEGGKEGGKEDGGSKKDRGKAFCFPELMCCMFDCLGTNERFSDVKTTPVCLNSFNQDYTYRVKWMKEQDKWRDQHDKSVTDITPEQSIEEHVREVTTRTKDTPISTHPRTLEYMLTPTVG